MANPEALVTTEWAIEHLSDSGLRFVEVDVDTAAYEKGHLPGAVGWNWRNDLQAKPLRDIAGREQLEELLSRSGIDNETTIVLYGDNNNWFAAYAYWTLKYYGNDKVKLINGGRVKLEAEGRPFTTQEPSFPRTQFRFSGATNEAIRAYRDDVAARIGQAGLVDVRSPGEFSGELLAPENLPQEGAQRAGHIPTAKNIPWAKAVKEDGTFKDVSELKELYGAAGISADRETIAYCRIGERSAHTWFVLTELLGYQNVRNYDGSWTEWGSLIKAPIEN
ncbi:MAG: sulfurtransferase [Candidatus Dormibacteraeota bacterium]|nr:sulfurtransferase [Candidatus Dormibacteraeota bacterium]